MWITGYRNTIDVSGFYGEAPSYLTRIASAHVSAASARRTKAMEDREKEKIRIYRGLPGIEADQVGRVRVGEVGPMEFLPFVFESHGGLGQCAERVISKFF